MIIAHADAAEPKSSERGIQASQHDAKQRVTESKRGRQRCKKAGSSDNGQVVRQTERLTGEIKKK